MKQFGKILKFELKGYLKNKIFVGVTIFLVAAIAIAMFIPNILSAFKSGTTPPKDIPVKLVYAEDKTLSGTVKEYYTQAFPGYHVKVADGTPDDIKSQITSGSGECAFVLNSPSSYTYYVGNLDMRDSNQAIANTALQEVYRVNAMIQNGLSPEQANDIMSVVIESDTMTLGADRIKNDFYTYIMIFALYTVIMLYGQPVATNVASEKSLRYGSSDYKCKADEHDVRKGFFASCIVGFTQLVLVFGSALLLYHINKAQLQNPFIASIFDMPVHLFVYMLVFFVLGFLIYAFLYGAIGSTASKLEDISTMVLPVTFLFIIAFMVVLFSMISGNVNSVLMKVFSYIPFTSPMAMFARICMSTVARYEIFISIIILLGSTVGIGVLSAKIYRVGVLLYGTPPKFIKMIKEVLKKQ